MCDKNCKRGQCAYNIIETFSKEILTINRIAGKAQTFQYNSEEMFNTMLERFRKWEKEGKLYIVDIRDSIYNLN